MLELRRSGRREPSPEAARFRVACDLQAIGVYLFRRQIRRQYLEASEAQVNAQVREWLLAASEDWPQPLSGEPQLTREAVSAVLAAAGLRGFKAYLIAEEGLGTYIAVSGPALPPTSQALEAAGYKTERVPERLGEYLVAWRDAAG